MTLTIEFSPALLGDLKAKSIATDKTVSTLVTEAVEAEFSRDRMSLKDAMRQLQNEIAASGVAPDEAEEIFANEVAANRAERHAGTILP